VNVLLDTAVYLRVLLDRRYAEAAEPALRRIGPRLHLSSIVRAELTQGARGEEGRELVARLVRTLEGTHRLVTPTHGDWVLAGEVQSEIWDAHPGLRDRRLLHDALIAASARRIGALLVTTSERDFALLDPWLPTRRLPAEELERV
jgi:predicted nucleic acid-binding protein